MQRSRKGAEAAARAFLDTLNYAGATGNTKPLRTTYIAFCERCEAIADGIAETYENGGFIQGGAWVLQELRFYSISGNVAYIDAVVDYSAQQWKRQRNDETEKVAAQQGVLKVLNLRYVPKTGWRVSALDPTQ